MLKRRLLISSALLIVLTVTWAATRYAKQSADAKLVRQLRGTIVIIDGSDCYSTDNRIVLSRGLPRVCGAKHVEMDWDFSAADDSIFVMPDRLRLIPGGWRREHVGLSGRCVSALAVSPDGRLACVRRGRALQMLLARTGQAIRSVSGDFGNYPECVFSHDDRFAIVRDSSKSWQVMNLSNGASTKLGKIGYASFSPAAPVLAWADKDCIRTYNCITGIRDGIGTGPNVVPDHIGWSPDGRYIAYANYRQTLRDKWDERENGLYRDACLDVLVVSADGKQSAVVARAVRSGENPGGVVWLR